MQKMIKTLYTWKKPYSWQAFLRELTVWDLLEPRNFAKSIIGNFKFVLLAFEVPFPELGWSGTGNMYLLGILVIPLSHKCFTPFWNSLSIDSFCPLVTTAKLIPGDLVDRSYNL